ncbi:MAG TPA: histidine kinase [Micromonosporaceae bacterium]|nr:histidine kinase [Micromonosporaceae bacterium]
MTGLGLERGSLRRDLALAAFCLISGLVLFSLGTYRTFDIGPGRTPILFLIPLVTACVAVALRRVATRSSLALGTAAVVSDVALGGSLATLLVYTQVLYDACLYGPPRMWRWLLRISLALTGIAAVAGVAGTRSWQGVALGVPVVLVGVLPVVTGLSVRQYRDQAITERIRAEQTARLAELDRCQAITAERTRMARELHDVVANHLSAVAIHATAVLSVQSLDRRQVQEALRVIRENSVQGLAEMRQMISLLREPSESTAIRIPTQGGTVPDSARDRTDGAPAAGEEALRVRLAELDQLVARSRDAGLPVRLETTGPDRPLPASVDLAAYRIVQESLTNALKHGAGPAEVEIGYQPDRICLTIENPLSEETLANGMPSAGAGLIGMRERAALLQGRFDAGPYGDCWRVYAELPTTEVSP